MYWLSNVIFEKIWIERTSNRIEINFLEWLQAAIVFYKHKNIYASHESFKYSGWQCS